MNYDFTSFSYFRHSKNKKISSPFCYDWLTGIFFQLFLLKFFNYRTFHISVLPFQEKRGKHFLDDKKDKEAKILAEKERRKRERSPTPESMELKQLKRMKEIQDLVVKEEEKYVAEPLDPAQFMWDDK